MGINSDAFDEAFITSLYEKIKKDQLAELQRLQNKIERYQFLLKNEELFVPLSRESFLTHMFGEEEGKQSFSTNSLIHHIIDHMPPKLNEKNQFTYIFLQFFYYTRNVTFCDEENEVSHLSGWLKSVSNLIATLFNFYLKHHEMTLTEVKDFIHTIYTSCMHHSGNMEEYEDQLFNERENTPITLPRRREPHYSRFDASTQIYNTYKTKLENLFYFPLHAEKVLSLIDFTRLSLSREDFTIEHNKKQKYYRLHNTKDDIHVEAKNVNLLEYELAKWKISLYLQFYNQKEPDEVFSSKEDEQYWWKQRKVFEKIFADLLSTEE